MRKWQKIGLSESFECKNRYKVLKTTKVKNHRSAVSWNSEACLREVKLYDSDSDS